MVRLGAGATDGRPERQVIRDSQFDTRDVAEAFGVCPQAGTRKLDELAERLRRVARGLAAAEPGLREDRAAEMLMAAASGVAALARHDAMRARRWVRFQVRAAQGDDDDGTHELCGEPGVAADRQGV